MRFEFSVTVDLYSAGYDEDGQQRIGEVGYVSAEEVATGLRWIVGETRKLSFMSQERCGGYWVSYLNTSEYEARLTELQTKAEGMRAEEVGDDWLETTPNYTSPFWNQFAMAEERKERMGR